MMMARFKSFRRAVRPLEDDGVTWNLGGWHRELRSSPGEATGG